MAIVALLTDFGTRDHYAGTMKGVVLSVCADATLVDLTHDIAPQDVWGAGFALAAAYRYFPPATVFLCVVDPGVGSTRRAIAAEAGGYYFVGPDNGLFSTVFGEVAPTRIVELQERKYARSTISRTFEGRDRFAPAAGWLARGTDLRAFGPIIDNPMMLPVPAPLVTPAGVDGEIVGIDRFGNLITNIGEALIETVGREPRVDVGGHTIVVVATYSEVGTGELCALVGSTGLLEIAVNGGSAEKVLGTRRGDTVRLKTAP